MSSRALQLLNDVPLVKPSGPGVALVALVRSWWRTARARSLIVAPSDSSTTTPWMASLTSPMSTSALVWGKTSLRCNDNIRLRQGWSCMHLDNRTSVRAARSGHLQVSAGAPVSGTNTVLFLRYKYKRSESERARSARSLCGYYHDGLPTTRSSCTIHRRRLRICECGHHALSYEPVALTSYLDGASHIQTI